MPVETLRQNLIYLKKINYLSNQKMDTIMGHNSRIFERISNGDCTPQLPALKLLSDHFKISIDDLCRSDITVLRKWDLKNYYDSAQLSLKDIND